MRWCWRHSSPTSRFRGRVHETFKQYHAGVPVYGGGISRQLANNGLTVSIFGTIHQGIDLLEQRAGAGPATDDPPTLVILPTLVSNKRGGACTWYVAT